MEIESFAEIVKDTVEEQLGKEYQVTIRRVNKNNGVVYTGLNVKKEGINIAPVIYLDNHFDQYKQGSSTISEITDHVVKDGRKKMTSVDVQQFLNYETVRERIVYKLINTEKNKELLNDIPHIEFMDLSIVFQCLVSQKTSGSASILVHNTHMKLWDVTLEMLYQEAKENTQKLMPYEIKSIEETLCEIIKTEPQNQYGNDECMELSIGNFSDSVPLYVLSNKSKIEGAVCMLYPNLISNFSDTVRSSLYIIPSSIHELLLLPVEDDKDSEEIKGMIRQINDTQVFEEEILSYSLYYYDRGEGKITRL